MNTQGENLPFIPSEIQNQIVEITTVIEDPVKESRSKPLIPVWKQSVLHGYESTMRQHAAACEAGR